MIKPNIKHIPKIAPYNAKRYYLTEPFYIGGYMVPEYFVTDGASIPRLLWSVSGHPYHPLFIGPAIGHDYMYAHHIVLNITKEYADTMFKIHLLDNGISKYDAHKMYLAVKMFGGKGWREQEMGTRAVWEKELDK